MGIDYRNIVGDDAFKALLIKADFRNVIVHNNGICDTTFVSQHPNVEIRSQITPSTKFVFAAFEVVLFTVKKLDEIYQKEIRDVIISNITDQIKLTGLSKQDESV